MRKPAAYKNLHILDSSTRVGNRFGSFRSYQYHQLRGTGQEMTAEFGRTRLPGSSPVFAYKQCPLQSSAEMSDRDANCSDSNFNIQRRVENGFGLKMGSSPNQKISIWVTALLRKCAVESEVLSSLRRYRVQLA